MFLTQDIPRIYYNDISSIATAIKLFWKSGKVRLEVRYVIIFLFVQFWIRLVVVSYRGGKARVVTSPAVRSVNKSHDTRNCVLNEPEYAICVIFNTGLYYKALWLSLCCLMWLIRHNHNRLHDGHCNRKMSALGTAGDHADNPWKFRNDVIV